MVMIFVPKEVRDLERRVAANPESVKKFGKAGFSVSIQRGAGLEAGISDAKYEEAGAVLIDDLKQGYEQADLVLKIDAPAMHPELKTHEALLMKEGTVLFCSLVPQNEVACIEHLLARKISCFSTNLIPRITIAQKMDTLSSQASLAGYKAVILAANSLGKYFPLLMTAAGTITPAKVVILGAGVAGLQAIATARRLGANVEAYDVREVVKEQVESLGAKFIEIPTEENLEDAGGYAKQQSEAFLNRQREVVGNHLASADVAITTALIPGRKAPLLITAEMVERMPLGSVIVDMAVAQGGNCELSEPGRTAKKHGVTIIGELNIPATMPIHASQLFSRNLYNLVTHLMVEGEFQIDVEEPITDGALLTHEGVYRHEPTKELIEKGAAS